MSEKTSGIILACFFAFVQVGGFVLSVFNGKK